MALDRFLKSRRKKKLSKPVISIGNITLGGTGKTPLLIRLLEDLQAMNFKPAVLTRGYRGFMKPPAPSVIFKGAEGLAPEQETLVSDETLLVARKHPEVPIGAGPDRIRSAERLMERFPIDVFVLDDGFQHWLLERDVDVVCVDATSPWGEGHLVPQGRLREPVSSLARAHAIVLTRTELMDALELERIKAEIRKVSSAPVLLSRFDYSLWEHHEKKPVPVDRLMSQVILTLSAIGNPKAFEEYLKRLGAVVEPMRFRDHHEYTEDDLKNIQQACLKKKAIAVTTEKDAVKMERFRLAGGALVPSPLFVLKMELRWGNEGEARWQTILKESLMRPIENHD